MKYRINQTPASRDIKPFQFGLVFIIGFGLPYLGSLGRIIGIGILIFIVIALLINSGSGHRNTFSYMLLIGFLCGSEIFFRDYVLKGLTGYLGIEYILIIFGILNLLLFSKNNSGYQKKYLILFWIIYCIWVVASMTYSMYPVAGRWFLSMYFAGLAIFTIVSSTPDNDLSIDALMQGIAIGAFLVCGTALQFYITSSQSLLIRTFYRFAHALCSPNQIAITMAAGAFALMYLLLVKGKKEYTLPTLVLLTALIATFSRGVLIGFIFSIFILLIFMPGAKKTQLILLMILLIPPTYYLYTKLPDVFAGRYQNITLDQDRIGIYAVGLSAWQAKPVLGYGIGSWEKIYPVFSNLFTDAPAYISDAHNIVLQILVETGGVGAFFFLLFILFISIESIKRRSPLALSSLGLVFIIGVSENWKIAVIYVLIGIVLLEINKKTNDQLKSTR